MRIISNVMLSFVAEITNRRPGTFNIDHYTQSLLCTICCITTEIVSSLSVFSLRRNFQKRWS